MPAFSPAFLGRRRVSQAILPYPGQVVNGPRRGTGNGANAGIGAMDYWGVSSSFGRSTSSSGAESGFSRFRRSFSSRFFCLAISFWRFSNWKFRRATSSSLPALHCAVEPARDFCADRVVSYRMINSNEHPTISTHRNPSRNAEQQLCSDALDSSTYDHMSDKEWITLCEQVAEKEREVSSTLEETPQPSQA